MAKQTTNVVRFPRRNWGPVRVQHVDGEWLIIHRGQAWPFPSREAALLEANQLAKQINSTLVVEALRESLSCS